MKKIISLNDLVSKTYHAYKKHFKKMSSVLGVIFLVTVIPVVIEGLSENDPDLMGRWLQGIFGSNLNTTVIVLFIALALLLYLVLLIVNILLSIGFIQKIAHIEKESFQIKSVFLAGKNLIKRAIWLGIKTSIVSLCVLTLVGIPVGILAFLLFTLTPVLFAGIVTALLVFVAVVSLAFFGIHIAFSQLALYVDEKEGIDAIEHSVEIVQGNVWDIIIKVLVYYAAILVVLTSGVLILGVAQDLILRVVYGVSASDAMNQLVELRVTGVIVTEVVLSAVVNLVNIFVVFPLTMIASISLYQSLRDVFILKNKDSDATSRYNLKPYIARLYKTGWFIFGAAILITVIALTVQ